AAGKATELLPRRGGGGSRLRRVGRLGDDVNRPGRIDREPRKRAGYVDDRRDVERKRPRLPAIGGEAEHERSDEAAEVPERVHAAGDDAGVIRRDVDWNRPARAEGEVGGGERHREQR